jgi:transposase
MLGLNGSSLLGGAQADWGVYGSNAVGNTRRRLSFFVMVLAFSRQMYVEFTVSQTMEHFLACHEHAFRAFNGVPTKIPIENLTQKANAGCSSGVPNPHRLRK